jgi:hypothetical protein
VRQVSSEYARKFANWIIGALATVIAFVVPPKRAYFVLWRLIDISFPAFEVAYNAARQRPRSGAWRTFVLRRALSVMTRCRPGFDLALRVDGGEELRQALQGGAPIILCTAHFGLTFAAPRVLADFGYRVALIADQSKDWNGWHWGLREPLQILPSGFFVMLQARAILRAGTPLICYVDYMTLARDTQTVVTCISPNAFQMARRLGATIFFLGSRLETDGSITIEFHRPRYYQVLTSNEAELCAAEFANFASDRTGWTCVVQRKTTG